MELLERFKQGDSRDYLLLRLKPLFLLHCVSTRRTGGRKRQGLRCPGRKPYQTSIIYFLTQTGTNRHSVMTVPVNQRLVIEHVRRYAIG